MARHRGPLARNKALQGLSADTMSEIMCLRPTPSPPCSHWVRTTRCGLVVRAWSSEVLNCKQPELCNCDQKKGGVATVSRMKHKAKHRLNMVVERLRAIAAEGPHQRAAPELEEADQQCRVQPGLSPKISQSNAHPWQKFHSAAAIKPLLTELVPSLLRCALQVLQP